MGVVDFLSSISGIVSSVAVVASFIVAYCVYRDSTKPYVVVFIEHDRDHEWPEPCRVELGERRRKRRNVSWL